MSEGRADLARRAREIDHHLVGVKTGADAKLEHTIYMKTVPLLEIRSIAWSKNGRYLAPLFIDGTIRIYDKEMKKCIFQLVSRESGTLVTELSFSSNDRYLAFGGRDRIKIFDLQKKESVEVPALDCLSTSLGKLAQQKSKTLLHEALDARKLAWAPSSPILAVALKKHDPFILYSSALVLF